MRQFHGLWIVLVVSMLLTPARLVAEPLVANGVTGELKEQLLSKYQSFDENYTPRTEHFDEFGEPRYLNRLINESSPYLLQHAHNPVNWYPWGSEAFEAALASDKPVFLSIGYATCHWCHVMERESFENEEIAEFLNEHFIAIKVDREQRPDVDSTYMTAVQMLTGSGGWPLSSFLNPGSQPFHGGTYYPPAVFKDMLERVVEVWGDSREELDESAEQISQALATATSLSEKVRDLGDHDISAALTQLLVTHDTKHGGFGQAPKFPREPSLLFLLDQARRTSDKTVLDAVNFTLKRIAAGGIHDQVGGGFHRYATDANWLIPHFEKMLYNQAGLALAYTEAWLITADIEHKRTARRALDYVLREMTSPEGLFYSATDADSGEGEGEFFIWTIDEINEFLSAPDARIAKAAWNMTERGNFEERNILHHTGALASIASGLDLSTTELMAKLDSISMTLLEKRQSRPAPIRDEKMITGWNGMMINAFARAGDVFSNEAYLSAAKRAADEIIGTNDRKSEEGKRLWRAKFNGQWSVNAGQADYAYLAEGLLSLYDVTGELTYLHEAESLVDSMNEAFWDNEEGGYFMGDKIVAGATLPTRPKDIYDNAFQSGNAAAARVLAKLWNRTGKEQYRETALSLFGAFSESISRGPSNFPYLLTALSELQNAEIGQRQYAARGKVRLHGQIEDGEIAIDVAIADGWHINAHEPLQDYLIGTSLMDAANTPIKGTQYPAAERTVLGFQRAELALYHDTFSITAPVPSPVIAGLGNLVPVSLELQACNDEVCLAPETVTLTLAQ